jgi:hypothetical protein
VLVCMGIDANVQLGGRGGVRRKAVVQEEGHLVVLMDWVIVVMGTGTLEWEGRHGVRSDGRLLMPIWLPLLPMPIWPPLLPMLTWSLLPRGAESG